MTETTEEALADEAGRRTEGWRALPLRLRPALRRRLRRLASILLLASSTVLTGCAASTADWNFVPDADQAGILSGDEMNDVIDAGFIARDPAYKEQRARFGQRLGALAASLAAIQTRGKTMACSTQMYLEADWLHDYTMDWARLDRQLAELAQSLTNLDQSFANRQSPGTGLWGVCYDEWFLQTEATLSALEDRLDESWQPSLLYPIRVPEKIDTPEKMKAYLRGLLVSDIARTGRDNRGELGNVTTIFSSVFFKGYLREYVRGAVGRRHDDESDRSSGLFQAAYEDFLDRWQDPRTGYWGAWYRSDGRLYKSVDLSITYHTIAYRHGQVAYWPQIIDTTLRIRNDPYPFGWLHRGHLNNHNNYDVARILKYGWPHMSDSQKREAGDAIGEMLAWTLTESLDPDGSFKTDPTFFSSVSADYYFGVSFLDEIGFWNPAERFWTQSEFPDSAAVCRRIKARLADFKSPDPQVRVALEKLNAAC